MKILGDKTHLIVQAQKTIDLNLFPWKEPKIVKSKSYIKRLKANIGMWKMIEADSMMNLEKFNLKIMG